VNINQQLEQEDTILKVSYETLLNKQEIIKCLQEIYDFSKELFDHSVNTALLSLMLGMKTDTAFIKQKELYIAGLLHDYGKLLIPKAILEKKDSLTSEERKIMELHPAAGFLSLKRDTMLSENVVYAVLDHHEKSDGSGYGSGKVESSISEYAKIISIVDMYDAMASDRAYRKAISIHTVQEYLYMSAGRSLDYDLVMQFIDLLKENPLEEMEGRHRAIIRTMLTVSKYPENISYL
jgi:HD-GYP domain-containing protein (c-di-GMP phosphodiesterase class II)